jgi:hypothetical protein
MAETKVLNTFVYTKRQIEDYAKQVEGLASQGWEVKAALEIAIQVGCLCNKKNQPQIITILQK